MVEVPSDAELAGLPIEVAHGEEPWVSSVTARASDGGVVTLSWDEVAASVSVRWEEDGEERLAIDREAVSKVSVREEHGRVEFWTWSGVEGLTGKLVVRVGARVNVTDALLRT